jgi:hypothetical protein
MAMDKWELRMSDQTGAQTHPVREGTAAASKVSGLSGVVSVFLTSAPVWVTGPILFILAGVVVIAVITVCAAVFAGREVTMWPPHIAAYEAPEVANCRTITAALPALVQTDENEASRLGLAASSHLKQIEEMERDYTRAGANTVYIAQSLVDMKQSVTELDKRLDDILNKVRQRGDDVARACIPYKRSGPA